MAENDAWAARQRRAGDVKVGGPKIDQDTTRRALCSARCGSLAEQGMPVKSAVRTGGPLVAADRCSPSLKARSPTSQDDGCTQHRARCRIIQP